MTIHKLFLKLLLKNKFFWNEKLKLNSNLVVKSFYKNAELEFLPSMLDINNKLLKVINNSLYEFIYIYKLVCFIYLRNINLNKLTNLSNSLKILRTNKLFNLKTNSKLIINSINNSMYMANNNLLNNSSYIYNILYYLYIYYTYLLSNKLLHKFNWKVSKLPKHSEKITILRSPHIDKKSREQFEIITHKTRIIGLNVLGDATMNYLKSKSNNTYITITTSCDIN